MIDRRMKGIVIVCLLMITGLTTAQERAFYQIKVYTIESEQQEQRMDAFLKAAFSPAMHRAGIEHIGVFKPVSDDEHAGKRIYVLIPFKTITQFEELGKLLAKDKLYLSAGSDYLDAAHDDPPYSRIESTLLRSFKVMPEYGVPTHTTPVNERIYELRSYQGASEKLYEKKVEMFNDGGETKLFIDLGFQPIFFGEVISGSVMPNLMYLSTFESKKSQDEHWGAFVSSPVWDALKNEEQYKNTVSHIDKFLLHPTEYSDL
jgi:hypothetical protein